MTMTFVSLVLIEFFKAYSFRSEKHSLMIRPFANKWLNLAITWELALLVIVVCTPFLQQVFGTVSLPWERWAIVVGAALTVLPVLELGKSMVRRGWFGTLS
jgi:Ca2+-transporting ATPase